MKSFIVIDDEVDPDDDFYNDISPVNGVPFSLQRKCITAYLNIERAKEAKYTVQMKLSQLEN